MSVEIDAVAKSKKVNKFGRAQKVGVYGEKEG